jgi:hypothetical protein
MLLSAGAGALMAQSPTIASGSRVRITVSGRGDKVIGILRERTPDSLLIVVGSSNGSLRSIGVDQVAKVETWARRPGIVGRSLAIGTGVGALAGLLAGLVAPPPCAGGAWCIGPQDQGDMVLVGVGGGALLGGIVGLIAGATNRDGWVPAGLWVIPPAGANAGFRVSWRLALPRIHSH